MVSLIALAQILPGLVQTGFNVYDLVKHASGNTAPSSPVESYIKSTVQALPGLITAGVDITGAVTHMRDTVEKMRLENRGPTQAERDEQNARLTTQEKRLDKAAMQRGPGT